MWEYQIVRVSSEPLDENELNSYGENGWELVTAIHYTEPTQFTWLYIFKHFIQNPKE